MAAGSFRLIASRHNPRLKELRAALARGGRTPAGLVAIEGEHLVAEAARSGLRFATVFVCEGATPAIDLPPAVERLVLTRELFARAAATEQPQGIAALVEPPAPAPASLFSGIPLLLVLAGLQDPGNVGTLIRSAEAFSATGVILLPGTASPWNPKALRASAGSVFRLPLLSAGESDALALLTGQGVATVAAVARDGAAPDRLPLQRACALLIGNEGAGLSPGLIEAATHRATISMPGRIESLNAAIAGSLLLYEAARSRGEAARQRANPIHV